MTFRIVATGTGVSAPFFAALDARDLPIWTDQDCYALSFNTPSEAEDSAREWFGREGWKVQPAC